KQSDGLFCELAMYALGRAGRVVPMALSQMPVGVGEGNMPFQERCHHIFRDGLFVAKAIAYNGRIGNRVKIYGVIARAWHMKELQLPRLRQVARKSAAHNDIRGDIGLRM